MAKENVKNIVTCIHWLTPYILNILSFWCCTHPSDSSVKVISDVRNISKMFWHREISLSGLLVMNARKIIIGLKDKVGQQCDLAQQTGKSALRWQINANQLALTFPQLWMFNTSLLLKLEVDIIWWKHVWKQVCLVVMFSGLTPAGRLAVHDEQSVQS